MHGEKARSGLYKNAMFCSEKILEAVPKKKKKKKSRWPATCLSSHRPSKSDEQDCLALLEK